MNDSPVYALTRARQVIARMLKHGEWYDPQGALDAVDAALEQAKGIKPKNTREEVEAMAYSLGMRYPLASPVTECADDDSPWLVCKPCAATGKCALVSRRTAFEAWATDRFGNINLTRSPDGYITTVSHPSMRGTYASLQMLWEAWQARS